MDNIIAAVFAALLAAACSTADLPQASQPSGPPDHGLDSGRLAPMSIQRAFPGISLRGMIALTHPDDGGDRLFVAQKHGVVVSFPNDPAADRTDTFLDISDRVNDRGSEEGLLGLAFDPAFTENGYLYVYYTAASPRRGPDPADPS